MLVELNQIEKTYQGKLGEKYSVLRGVDLQMSEGTMISILGKSGSGKTTLLKILGLL